MAARVPLGAKSLRPRGYASLKGNVNDSRQTRAGETRSSELRRTPRGRQPASLRGKSDPTFVGAASRRGLRCGRRGESVRVEVVDPVLVAFVHEGVPRATISRMRAR